MACTRNVALAAAVALAAIGGTAPANAQECFIGEVRMFAGNFAPRGWALAQGQILAISQNQALFSILGTTYGGDGRTTFALPNLGGRVPVGTGQSPGLQNWRLGMASGQENVTLNQAQMPQHGHAASTIVEVHASDSRGSTPEPGGAVLANGGNDRIYGPAPAGATLAPEAATATTTVQPSGGGQAVPVTQPSLGMNYIICLFGIYPSHN